MTKRDLSIKNKTHYSKTLNNTTKLLKVRQLFTAFPVTRQSSNLTPAKFEG